eukprot:TRINITY_DN977_c0_g2_i3.p1 TRINITY_DN977_c0_g2~~TRINITY_DN977_c0_g2_i3.p1  ORF type:complete len:562 (+),score=135.21 TRINITY_DN977_c0_g2_i3:192-1688(+)
MDNHGRSLESYSSEEWMGIECIDRKVHNDGDMNFRCFLSAFRKKNKEVTEVKFEGVGRSMILWTKHGCLHLHELRSVLLKGLRKEVSMDHHQTSVIHWMAFSCPSLTKLDLSGNVRIGDEGLIRMAEGLEMNTSLRELNLRHCGIGPKAAEKIGKMLEKNSCLVKLDISWNMRIGVEGFNRMVEGLERNTSLKELVVMHVGIEPTIATKIAHMLRRNDTLVHLDLRFNKEVGDDGTIQIAEALKMNTSLKALYLSDCSIGLKGANKIVKALEENGSLVHLELGGNEGIGDEGCIRMAECLKKNSSIKILGLDDCGISQRGAETIGEMLKRNTSLLELDLSWNQGLADEGFARIAKGLETNTSLKKLVLRDCFIGPVGAEGIREMLKKNASLVKLDLTEGLEMSRSLKELILSQCLIGMEEATILGEVLKKNNSLVKLSLERNPCFVDEGGIRIAEGLEMNTSLKMLYLPRDSISIRTEQRITDLLDRNRRQEDEDDTQ